MSSARALELVGDPEIAARMVPLARLTEGRGRRSTGIAALDDVYRAQRARSQREQLALRYRAVFGAALP